MAAFGGRMKIVAYLNHEKTLFYRLVLDVLLDEEARLGVHLSTEQIRLRFPRCAGGADQLVSEGWRGFRFVGSAVAWSA